MEIKEIIIDVVKDHLGLNEVVDETIIFGKGSTLDSLGLVSLIVEIEEKIYEEYKEEIVIASERAMSRTKSPFNNVKNLVEFVKVLCEEK